jgi:hypothetical protein
MRQQIAQEIIEAVEGQILDDGCLKWEEGKKYPIFFDTEAFVGYATDIRREADGVITAEVSWSGNSSYKGTTVYATKAIINRDEDGFMRVKTAELTSLFVATDVPWGDGPNIKAPEED